MILANFSFDLIRALQEEQRCRQLELKVEAMSSKVSAAEAHRRRLEALLEETRRDKDILEVSFVVIFEQKSPTKSITKQLLYEGTGWPRLYTRAGWV